MSRISRKSKRRKSDPKFILTERIENDARWQPEDDKKLVTAIEQVKDIHLVHSAITFSCYFTVHELENRWHSLLFNKTISKASQREFENLPPQNQQKVVEEAALFSAEENQVLQQIELSPTVRLESFVELLENDVIEKRIFHSCRSAKMLYDQWQLLYRYNLLKGQTVPHPAMSLHHQDVTLSERLEELTSEVDSQSEALSSFNRASIRKLESEIVDLSRGLLVENKPESHKFCAHLEAEFVEFFIPRDKRLISIGRGPDVDLDLSREIGSARVHRRHCTISRSSFESRNVFHLRNIGELPLTVNGVQLYRDDEAILRHNSIIQIQNVDLFFRIFEVDAVE